MPRPIPPLVDSVIDTIGCTPAVNLRRAVASRGLQGRVIAKLELLNPGFSKKDRVGLEMVRQAKASGQLAPGQTVVELTSGNTGTGLAIACVALGHPFIAVMSKGNTPERATMMRALGARVELVDQASGGVMGKVTGEDLALVAQRTEELVKELGAFRASQFDLQSNPLAHELYTGPELWGQAQGKLDAFVDFSGTTGSFVGVMRFLRKVNPEVRGYLIEPVGAAVMAGQPVTNAGHRIQGGGYSLANPPLLDRSLVTEFLTVNDEQATAGARELARLEGIFGGYSSGANYHAAMSLLAGRESGNTVAMLVCDSGLKYVSTDLYE